MNINVQPTPEKTVESLVELKYKIYRFSFPLGLIAVILVWYFKAASATASGIGLLIFWFVSAYLIASIVALWKSKKYLPVIETSLFFIIATSLLARYYDILFISHQPKHHEALLDLLYWFPIVYIIAYLVFETRAAQVAWVFLSVVVISSLVHTIPMILKGELDEFVLLARFYLANAATLMLLTFITRLKVHITRARTRAEIMEQIALTDALTGIANRRQLEQLLRREILIAERYHHPFSVILFDIDHFKQVNDTFGHEAGDTVLKGVADLVNTNLRAIDVLGRWGGEEFLTLTPDTTVQQALQLAERLRQRIEGVDIAPAGKITASFGVATYQSKESPPDLVRRADQALYKAKEGGRNRVETAIGEVK